LFILISFEPDDMIFRN